MRKCLVIALSGALGCTEPVLGDSLVPSAAQLARLAAERGPIRRHLEAAFSSPGPLGRLIGEPDFGQVSRAILAFGEGAVFGLGLAYGLMRRPCGAPEPLSGRT